MKYLLFILMGIVPLGVLTVQSLSAAAVTITRGNNVPNDFDAKSNANEATLVKNANDLLLETRKYLSLAEKFFRDLALAIANPYDAAIDSPEINEGPLTAVAQDWKRFKEARELATQCVVSVKPFAEINRVDLEELKSVPNKLTTLVGQLQPTQGARGIADLKQAVEDQIPDVKTMIAVRETKNSNDKFATLAIKSFDSRDYQDCIKYVEKFDGEIPPNLSLLVNRAKFHAKADRLKPEIQKKLKAEPEPTWAALLDELDKLVTADLPKSLTDDEELLVSQFKKASGLLQMKMALHEFLQKPAHSFQWAKEAKTLVNAYPFQESPDSQKKIREAIHKWCAAGLPDKQVDDVKYKFVIDENGTVIEGYFKSEANDTYFKYWEKLADMQRNSPNYVTKVPKKLLGEKRPMAPLPIFCVEEYRRERNTLLGSTATKQVWESFLENCKKNQSVIDDYRKRGGSINICQPDKSRITLEKEIDFAQHVVNMWPELHPLLAY